MTAAVWVLGGTVLAGVGLSAFWLAGRPVRGAAHWAGVAHGVAGAVGTAMVIALAWRAPDAGGFARLAAAMTGAALVGGLVVAWAKLRRRKPSTLAVMLHAAMGAGGAAMMLGYGP